MNEYTNERAKKELEEQSLIYFMEVYKNVTGESIKLIAKAERPDFICVTGNEIKIGIELTEVRRGHPYKLK